MYIKADNVVINLDYYLIFFVEESRLMLADPATNDVGIEFVSPERAQAAMEDLVDALDGGDGTLPRPKLLDLDVDYRIKRVNMYRRALPDETPTVAPPLHNRMN